jgi:glycine/serine hydroxymethyltransferase
MSQIAEMVADLLHNLDDSTMREQVRTRSRALCERFPLPY